MIGFPVGSEKIFHLCLPVSSGKLLRHRTIQIKTNSLRILKHNIFNIRCCEWATGWEAVPPAQG